MRPDIRRLESVVRGAEAAAGMAKAVLSPGAGRGRGGRGREGDPGLDDENFGNTVGVQMAWNLYAGGADRARLAEAGAGPPGGRLHPGRTAQRGGRRDPP